MVMRAQAGLALVLAAVGDRRGIGGVDRRPRVGVEANGDAIADGRGSYRLAYYTPVREKNRKEHKIRLQSSRKGVRLLASQGYFHVPVEPDAGAAERAAFSNECHTPFDATDIGLRVALSRPQAGEFWRVAIRIDPADVLLEQRGGTYQGELALLFAFYSQGAFKDAPGPTQININLTPDQFKKAQQHGIDVAQSLPVSSEIDKIRVIALDRRLYALGSVTLSAVK